MILVKNWKFLSSVLFFEQGLDMCCYEKEGFLDYKVSFSHSQKIYIFPKFGQKFKISLESVFL